MSVLLDQSEQVLANDVPLLVADVLDSALRDYADSYRLHQTSPDSSLDEADECAAIRETGALYRYELAQALFFINSGMLTLDGEDATPPSEINHLISTLFTFYRDSLTVRSYADDARLSYPEPAMIRAAVNAPAARAWLDRIARYITPDGKTEISTLLALRTA